MLRRLTPVLIVMLAVLAACRATPALSEPSDIISQGINATSELTSFHVSLAVEGTVTMPDSGGSFDLEGTTLEADIDLDSENLHLTFDVPAFMSLSGEVLVIGSDLYVMTSLSGDKWSHSDVAGMIPGASPEASPDIQSMIDDVEAFLLRDGVEATKLDDADCGGRSCYHVQVSLSPDLMHEDGDDASTEPIASIDPADIFGEALVLDLLFDRENLWLTEVSTSVDAAELGSLSATITFSAFDEAVELSPPPAADVTEGELNFPNLPGFPIP